MNYSLKPTYQRLIGEYWVLWYEISNSYSVVTSEFKHLLDLYLQSDTVKTFENELAIEDSDADSTILLQHIENYLENCNKSNDTLLQEQIRIDRTQRSLSEYYSIQGKTIQINYDCDLVLNTIHPAIAHFSTQPIKHPQVNFDLFLKEDKLYLYENEQLISCVPKRDYHLIQGKFIMQLLCFIHDKVESDWIGTFHGSTITDGNNAILFIGKSGKGKSTLSALLSQNGFDLLADDVSPMLSETKTIYYNPSAISLKSGAFSILEPYIKNLPEIEFNKDKGVIKYLPCQQTDKAAYPCKAIIIVNYQPEAKTNLESVSIKTIMETLIPDSWLSPNLIHANEFLDWLETMGMYQLTYSDTSSVTNEISQLFQYYKH